jgi:hypothetical protein
MQLACPQCGTRDVRVSQRQTFSEYFKGLLGIYPLRCRRCRTRWLTSTWAAGAWKYARCPRCYRQDLATWSQQYYRPRQVITFLLRIGATPYRCAACRCNFASFRPCKERYSWRKRQQEASAPLAQTEARDYAPDSAEIAQETLEPN